MAFRVLDISYLRNLAAGAITAPAAAAGYSVSSLVDDGLDAAWRANGAAAGVTIECDLGAVYNLNCGAIFGVRGVAGGVAAVSGIQFQRYDAGSGTWVWLGSIGVPNARGDLFRSWTLVGAQLVRVGIDFSSAQVAEVREICVGECYDLTRMPERDERAEDHGTLGNRLATGGWDGVQLRDRQMSLRFRWPSLLEAEADELIGWAQATRGQAQACVIQPSTDRPAEVFHGRIQDVVEWDVRYPLWRGLEMEFDESGRGLQGA